MRSRKLNAYYESLPGEHRRVCELAIEEARAQGLAWLLADIARQSLALIKGTSEEPQRSYSISTARLGIGSVMDSERTPLGLHRVCEKIGDGLPGGMVLSGRRPTGEVATPRPWIEDGSPVRITSRILRLRGLNPGLNSGHDAEGRNVDSFDRYVYIHGTDRLFKPGQRISRGCLNMADADAIELFDLVPLDTLLLISGGEV